MTQPKVSAARSSGLQDDHDPSDIGQRVAGKQKSQMEGPAAYAPHDEGEKNGQGIVRDERGQDDPPLNTDEAPRAFPDRDPVRKKTGEF